MSPPPCVDGRVASIEIRNRSVFDVDPGDGSRLSRVFRLANRLHMDTSPRFVRRELLLEEGDCWDPLRAQESGRILRQYGFLATADVEGVRRPDGDWTLRVDTRDEWTTKLQATVSLEDGVRLERVSLLEENLLGRGILVSTYLEERREHRDYGLVLETPQTFGTRVDTRLRAGRTRVGTFVHQSLLYPFVGEVGRVGVRQQYRARDAFFPYRIHRDPMNREVLVPIREEEWEFTTALRLGVPGNLTILGAGLSRESLAFPGFPEAVEVATRGNYDATEPAPPELVEEVGLQQRPRASTRANFLLGQRSIRYEPRTGLDALQGVQDVPLGVDLGIGLARSLSFLQQGEVGSPDDLFVRVNLFGGAASRDWVLNTNVRVEGRQVYGDGPEETGWRDILAEADLFLYGQPSWLPAQTLLLRLAASGGWAVDTPYQLTLGGRNGVRGYPERSFPGGRRVLVTLEDRIRIGWPAPHLLDTGATLFVDAGAMLPGDVPFGARSGVRTSVGGGLRLGFPAGTRGVIRIDLAFPLNGGSGPVFRATVGEIVGLVAGFLDEDMQRSRRAGVAQEFAGVGR